MERDSLKNLLYSVGTLAIALVLLLWSVPQINNRNSEVVETASPSEQGQTDIKYEGIEGQTALKILKSRYDVGTQNFAGIGEFVNRINGREADSTHFWAFYVNNKLAEVGASDYITKDGDAIEWKLEEIK